MLRLKNITKIYKLGILGRNKITAVDNFNFNFKKGKITSLIGESGSGKSTIGKIILKLLSPTSGKLYFNTANISKLKKRDMKQYYNKVQGVFQDPFSSFNPIAKIDRIFKTVRKNYFKKMVNSKWKDYLEEKLHSVGLESSRVLSKYPHQLSGGQLQRLLIARALLLNIKFLVADEIISMLDASIRIDILNILGELKNNGLSILFITHDLHLGYYISDYTIILYKGSIVEMGETDEIYKNPLHPYTKNLFNAVPRLDKKWDFEENYKNNVEYLKEHNYPCKYYRRCPEKCDYKENPELIKINKNHFIACHTAVLNTLKFKLEN